MYCSSLEFHHTHYIENEGDMKPNYNGAMKEVVTYMTSMSFVAEAVENEESNYKKRKNSFTLVFSGKLSPFTGMLRTQIKVYASIKYNNNG